MRYDDKPILKKVHLGAVLGWNTILIIIISFSEIQAWLLIVTTTEEQHDDDDDEEEEELLNRIHADESHQNIACLLLWWDDLVSIMFSLQLCQQKSDRLLVVEEYPRKVVVRIQNNNEATAVD